MVQHWKNQVYTEKEGKKIYLVEMEGHFSYLDDHIARKLSQANPANCARHCDLQTKYYSITNISSGRVQEQ